MGEGGSEAAAVDSAQSPQRDYGALRVIQRICSIVDGPVTYFREKIVDPARARNTYPYYHRKYPRVPTIDQCDEGDKVCWYEANEQFLRDRIVDKQIVLLLNDKYRECAMEYGIYDSVPKCAELLSDYDTALTNYHIKYGDLNAFSSVLDCFMKQKHRLIWQRRNPDKDIVGLEKRKEFYKEMEEKTRKVFSNDKY